MPTHRVLLTRRMPAVTRTLLEHAGLAVDELEFDDAPPRSLLLDRVRGCIAIIPTLADRIDVELLTAAGPTLRIVANYAVGIDNIDLAACQARGVRASNTPGVLTEATADIAWTLILSAARRAIEGDRLVRSGQWAGWSPTQLLGLELHGATLGILGAGRIGTAVALRSAGFGMHVLYTHPRPNVELEHKLAARRVELDELVRASDVLSLHIPMRPGNEHLLDARRLALLKPHAILINTARGRIVDEAALIEALRARRFAAAGLDVYEFEPRLSPGLSELPNVVLLPHLGSATTTTRDRMAQMAVANVLAAVRGDAPPNAVA